MVHNHPSGECAPSDRDIRATWRLIKAGRLLDIRVDDHMIIGDGQYYSFQEETPEVFGTGNERQDIEMAATSAS